MVKSGRFLPGSKVVEDCRHEADEAVGASVDAVITPGFAGVRLAKTAPISE